VEKENISGHTRGANGKDDSHTKRNDEKKPEGCTEYSTAVWGEIGVRHAAPVR
jgi:hypothetical protein